MKAMNEKRARVVSLVPSWTETLLWADVEVIGRTRFCVHPAESVKSIPILGGTKGMDLQKLMALRPDYVILDREENKKEMADQLMQAGIKIWVSHVTDFESAAQFLQEMGRNLESEKLFDLSRRYLSLPRISQEIFLQKILLEGSWKDLTTHVIEYVIWKNPYMVIGQNTFISEVLKRAGLEVQRSEKYPSVEEAELKKSFCLFSSEPFPFQKEFTKLTSEGFRGVLVDGEKISWYGIRNLLFLEGCSG